VYKGDAKMNLYELGQEYITTATALCERAAALSKYSAPSERAARELASRIYELRRIATRLKKYGRHLCHYYERGTEE
jgi:hypothetical protein